MNSLKGIGLEFEETMSGWIGISTGDFEEGKIAGQRENTPIRLEAKIIIDDLDSFIKISGHRARLEGTVTFEALGGTFAIEDGVFSLFTVDPSQGTRQMIYAFRFTAADGQTYFFSGEKRLKDDPGFDLAKDMTTLFTTIYVGPDKNGANYGAGQLFFDLKDTPALLASIQVTGVEWWEAAKVAQAKLAFLSFAWGALRQEYLSKLNPLYDTEYENLVLSGRVWQDGSLQDFFLVSGIHDRDFPWGDGEIFWDVLLVIGDQTQGYKKYCITDRTLAGLQLSVSDGSYRYQGPIYELTEGFSTSFSQMRNREAALVECQADFFIGFVATPYDITPFPFPIADQVLDRLASGLKSALESILPSEHLLGIFITPHTVTVNAGTLAIRREGQTTVSTVLTEQTFGEAERTSFRNIKKPTLLYGYICGIRPEAQSARVQIQANVLRTDRQWLGLDQMEAFLGALVSRFTSKELLLAGGELTLQDLRPRGEATGEGAPLFIKLEDPVLEVNNDHFPTAVFQRRIITVRDPSGETCLALEEDMDLMRLEAENSAREVVVASIKHPDKMKALEAVLEITRFLDSVKDKWEASGKSQDEFAIIIKPSFMFAYNVSDHTTYTDPDLVGHLVEVLRGRGGFENLTVVEAQSTYGEYFDKRSVRQMAEYLGYAVDGSTGYRLVDLTEDQSEERYLGPHLGKHPVPVTWRDADFRISFAKNKTHAYAYYTLTLKNIYGALSLADKFSEYHTRRGIYHTTIEYLQAFPVHFGLIDAHLSADGPFGVFADPEPNVTETIIGGADLVAVDWVGASKMGLDPKISQYMDLAIKAFGKPAIKLVGDPNPYKPWLNVPAALSLFAHYGLDANDYFGNLLYMAGAYMDEDHFTHKSKNLFMQGARAALKPLQEALFLQAGGEQSFANKLLGKFFTWLGSH